MSAMLTMLATSAVFLFDGGRAVALLFILVCGVALLQSRLIKSAGHWTQHSASAIQLNNSRNMSRTCTSAAELFYLRKMRVRAVRGLNEGGVKSHARVATSPHRTFLSHSDRLYGGYGWKRCYWSRTRDVPVHGSAKASARGLLGQNKKQRYFAMCKRCARWQTT